jgi:hypothetical protein
MLRDGQVVDEFEGKMKHLIYAITYGSFRFLGGERFYENHDVIRNREVTDKIAIELYDDALEPMGEDVFKRRLPDVYDWLVTVLPFYKFASNRMRLTA